MYPEPEVRAPLAARDAFSSHDDELLYLVPSTGIDWAALDAWRGRRAVDAPGHGLLAPSQGLHAPGHGLLAQGDGLHAPGNGPPARTPDCGRQAWQHGPVQRAFEVYAQVNPGARAVKFDRTELTYGELDSQADGLAVRLQQKGLRPGDFCAVCLEPSLAMVRAILAVLKAGGAYLLLDPIQPEQRIAAILDLARARLVITQEKLSARLGATDARTVLCGEDAADLPYAWPQECPTLGLSPVCATASVASNGSLSVVARTQMAMLARLEWLQEVSPIGQGDSVLLNTDPGLDGSEIVWSLCHGARVVIPPAPGATDWARVRQLVARERITVMHVVCTRLRPLPSGPGADELRSLRALMWLKDD